ncbi:LWR-salt protein [Halorubrum vacuolatum]|uniref:LWR-salt protein n=1 Tax=Halorubrum vacuolatum TaxID=63740 RepID=A0A238VU35_HALVU|nr:LWR-salt protein [Halorubrum vacuolatum]SNR37313.1 hypothetical protein SAMN06264855_10424 [Halorubrum vacuolatum]
MDAEYRFRVTVRLRPRDARVDPDRFDTTMSIPAVAPPEPGWLLFRDRLWRGKVGDPPTFRRFVRDRLGLGPGVDVVSAEFAELRTDEAYLTALRSAIADDLGRFNTDSVDAVLNNYLGSSIHVR